METLSSSTLSLTVTPDEFLSGSKDIHLYPESAFGTIIEIVRETGTAARDTSEGTGKCTVYFRGLGRYTGVGITLSNNMGLNGEVESSVIDLDFSGAKAEDFPNYTDAQWTRLISMKQPRYLVNDPENDEPRDSGLGVKITLVNGGYAKGPAQVVLSPNSGMADDDDFPVVEGESKAPISDIASVISTVTWINFIFSGEFACYGRGAQTPSTDSK